MTGMARVAWAAVIALTLVAELAVSPRVMASGLPVDEVAQGVFVHRGVHEDASNANLGDIANIGFIVGGKAVAVIDPGGSPRVGGLLRETVRSFTDKPIRYLILTHAHPYHVFGASAFAADKPRIFGHAKLPSAIARRSAYYISTFTGILGVEAKALKPPAVTDTVSDRLELDLGGRTLVLRAHPTAHTDHDLTVFDTQTQTLWASDLLFRERIPVVDGSIKGWLRVGEHLSTISAQRVVPGHGPVSADWPEALADQRRYLEILVRDVRAVLKANGTLESAVATVGEEERPHWLLFDDYNKRNVTASFVELEWE